MWRQYTIGQRLANGKRVSVRGLPNYVYDPTDSVRLAEKYDTALKQQLPSASQRGGSYMQWSRPHSGPNAPRSTMIHGGIMGSGLYINDGFLIPDLDMIPLPPPPKNTKQITLDGFFL